MSKLLTITGSKARLASLGRQLAVAVTADARTGVPVLVVPVSDECPYVSAGSNPDGRIAAMRLDTQSWEFLSPAQFIAAARGWTPEKAEAIGQIESHARCARALCEIHNNRRVRLVA